MSERRPVLNASAVTTVAQSAETDRREDNEVSRSRLITYENFVARRSLDKGSLRSTLTLALSKSSVGK